MTNEELDKARSYEAHRLNCAGQFTTVMEAYRKLVVTNWQPAPAIDPLDDAINEWLQTDCDGEDEDTENFRKALASRGLKIVSEVTAPNPSISAGEPEKSGSEVTASLSEQDKAEPVAPVDREKEVLGKVCLEWAIGEESKAVPIIRTYGDERYAEGERAGIEAAIEWFAQTGWISSLSIKNARRDLLGDADDE